MTRRMVRVRVDAEFIRQAMLFPYGTQIYDIQRDAAPDTFILFIENNNLPEVKEGNVPPLITPIYTKPTGEDGHFAVTMNWNLPEPPK